MDERRDQAEAVNSFVARILNRWRYSRVLVMGDFNEFEFASPLQSLSQNLSLMTEDIPKNERYSFIFQGNSQQLDHILVSPTLRWGAQVDIVHVNSEFAETDERASDHDPVVAQISMVC